MNRYINKIVSCLIVCCMLTASLGGCKEKETDSRANTSSSSSTSKIDVSSGSSISDKTDNNESPDATKTDDGSPVQEKYKNSAKLSFINNGNFAYKIVYPEGMTSEQTRLARRVYRAANDLSDDIPEYTTDVKAKAGNGVKEILIGVTNRKESETAHTKLTENRINYYDDYIICVSGNKICIDAGSTEALEDAVKFFNNTFLSEDAEEHTIPADYLYIKADVYETNMSIAGVDIANYVLVCEEYPSRLIYSGLEEIRDAIYDKTEYKVPIICTSASNSYKYKIEASVSGSDVNTYSVKASNTGIKVTGGHTYSVNAGLHALAQNINNIPKKRVIDIPKNYYYSGRYDKNTTNTDGYKLVWQDEFNGTDIDWNCWEKPISAKGYATYGADAGTKAENVSVKDGKLVLAATAEETDKGRAYWGVDLNANFDFQFGLVEIKAKINSGTACWPAFWFDGTKTLEKNYNGEIDAFEFFGTDMQLKSQLHSWWTSGRSIPGLASTDAQNAAGHIQHLSEADGNARSSLDGKAFSDGYHTFSMEWTPEYIRFACDGQVYCTAELTSMLRHPTYGYSMNERMAFLNKSVHLILSTSVGRKSSENGGVPAPDENTVLPNYFYVDWVHIYQQDGIGSFGKRF